MKYWPSWHQYYHATFFMVHDLNCDWIKQFQSKCFLSITVVIIHNPFILVNNTIFNGQKKSISKILPITDYWLQLLLEYWFQWIFNNFVHNNTIKIYRQNSNGKIFPIFSTVIIHDSSKQMFYKIWFIQDADILCVCVLIQFNIKFVDRISIENWWIQINILLKLMLSMKFSS